MASEKTELERLQATGIRRLGSPKTGFRYRRAGGRPVGKQEVARIRALKIPPAWKHAAINPSPRARLQAIGQDKAGRWQYRYHPGFRQRQEARKFHRILRFADSLPKMRARVERDLSRQGLGHGAS